MFVDLLTTFRVIVVECCLGTNGFDELEVSLSIFVASIVERMAYVKVARAAGRHDFVAGPRNRISGVTSPEAMRKLTELRFGSPHCQ